MKIIKQWPVFFLLLAFAISPLFQGVQPDVLVVIHILVLVVFFKVFLDSYQKLRIPYNSVSISIFLFYLWMALSISWSPAPSISLHIFVWLSIFPICFFIYSLKQPSDWPYLSVGILCVTLIFALIGIGQRLFTDALTPISLFLTRNTYGAMLNLIVLPATAYYISPKKLNYRTSILWGIVLFVLFFAIFQTSGKGVIISFCLGLIIIFVTSWKYLENSSFFRVAIIATAAFLFANIQTESDVVNRLEEALFIEAVDPSLAVRLLMWESAWQIINTSPIIGTGIGTFFIVYPAVRHPTDATSGNYLHNDYLQFWLETGLIGLCLMILIMVAIIMLFVRVLRKRNLMLHDRLEITGLASGLIAVAIHTIVDFNFYIVAILMIMGFMCARIQELSGRYFPELIRDFVPAYKLSRKVFILVAGVMPVIILSYSLPVAIADFYHRKASEYLENGQIENADLTIKNAILWNPENIGIMFQQFSLYRDILKIIKSSAPLSVRKDTFSKALLILNKIESINPLMGAVSENRGQLIIDNSDIVVENWEEKAIIEFKKALRLHPRLYRSRMALAKLLTERNELNEATLLMNDGIRYYYDPYLTGLDEFYHYCKMLNIQNGDSVKAKEIQIEKF